MRTHRKLRKSKDLHSYEEGLDKCQWKCRSSGEGLNGACSVHYEEGVSGLYTSAADTHLPVLQAPSIYISSTIVSYINILLHHWI
jgi:hypothetical protein